MLYQNEKYFQLYIVASIKFVTAFTRPFWVYSLACKNAATWNQRSAENRNMQFSSSFTVNSALSALTRDKYLEHHRWDHHHREQHSFHKCEPSILVWPQARERQKNSAKSILTMTKIVHHYKKVETHLPTRTAKKPCAAPLCIAFSLRCIFFRVSFERIMGTPRGNVF